MPLHWNCHFPRLNGNNKELYQRLYHVNNTIVQDHTKHNRKKDQPMKIVQSRNAIT